METTTYTNARNNLSNIIKSVNENHSPVTITRANEKSAIIISEDDYNSMKETLYLLSNPKNAKRIIESLEKNEFIEYDSAQDMLDDL